MRGTAARAAAVLVRTGHAQPYLPERFRALAMDGTLELQLA